MIAVVVAQNQVQLRLLKVFAEMCIYCDVMENAMERIDNVYQVLRVNTVYFVIVIEVIDFFKDEQFTILGIYAITTIERG